MMSSAFSSGTVHKIPTDLATVLRANATARATWNSITPLARNEWICWVESAKLIETRARRVERVHTELAEGIRRPCCWIGCIHRTDKATSPSVQGILDKRANPAQPRKAAS